MVRRLPRSSSIKWDAPAFDPDFKVDSLESFEPEVMRVFGRPTRLI